MRAVAFGAGDEWRQGRPFRWELELTQRSVERDSGGRPIVSVNRTGSRQVDSVMMKLTPTTEKPSRSPLRRVPRRRAGLAACVAAVAFLAAACASSAKTVTTKTSSGATTKTTTAPTTTAKPKKSGGGGGGIGF